MRISTFVPAILGLAVFTASTQALPTRRQGNGVEILKRGTENTLDALAELFVSTQTEVLAHASVELQADVCADVILKLNAKAKALGLHESQVSVNALEIQAKAKADVDLKAKINAYVNVFVIDNIDAHVRAVAVDVCANLDNVCFANNAELIVNRIAALINADIKTLVVKIKTNAAAYFKLRVNVHVKELAVNLGLAKVDINAIVRIRSDINVHVKAFIGVCAKALVNAKLIAGVKAL
ncbi:hypothetical protein BGZ76_008677 [Entomortierella beljakovae]|nr:hypothetical protein BGZ76_008677 [Entomortierella beljakovae]